MENLEENLYNLFTFGEDYTITARCGNADAPMIWIVYFSLHYGTILINPDRSLLSLDVFQQKYNITIQLSAI